MLHQSFDEFAHHVDTLHVLSALRDYYVGIPLCGFDELFVHRFKHFEITVYHHLHVASTLHDVPLYVAYQSLVGVVVNDFVERAADDILAIIRAENLRTKNSIEILSRIKGGNKL